MSELKVLSIIDILYVEYIKVYYKPMHFENY